MKVEEKRRERDEERLLPAKESQTLLEGFEKVCFNFVVFVFVFATLFVLYCISQTLLEGKKSLLKA